jgi:hypothetical protein
MTLAVVVPPNTSATVVRPGVDDEIDVGSGHHEFAYDVDTDRAVRWSTDPLNVDQEPRP